MKYRVYTYDVWYNEEEGWIISDVFHTVHTVEIPSSDDSWPTDGAIIKALRDTGLVKARIKSKSIGIEKHDTGRAYPDIYIVDRRRADRPEFELRAEPSR